MAGGVFGLVDGERGSMDIRDGKWQGFQGKDLDVAIKPHYDKPIISVTVSCLRNHGRWILLPELIEVFASEDGNDFNRIENLAIEPAAENDEVALKEISIPLQQVRANFIKVKVKNAGSLPDWHRSAGNQAWLFVDEILIQQ